MIKILKGKFCVALCGLFLVVFVSQAAAGTVAIVNTANPTASLAMTDLQAIFQCNKKNWSGAGSVTLYLPSAGSQASKDLATKVLGKGDESGIGQFYMQAVFTQKVSSAPKQMGGAAAVSAVAGNSGGIALVDESEAGAGVKVIKVPGL